MASTAIRLKGMKALPVVGDTKMAQAKFFKKLYEAIESQNYVYVDMHKNAIPPNTFDTKENDTVVWLEHNLNYKSTHLTDLEAWELLIRTLKDAPELSIADDWDYTVTDAKRRYIDIRAIYNLDEI